MSLGLLLGGGAGGGQRDLAAGREPFAPHPAYGLRFGQALKSFPTTMVISPTPDDSDDIWTWPMPRAFRARRASAACCVSVGDDTGRRDIEGLRVLRDHHAEPGRDDLPRHRLAHARRAVAVLHDGRYRGRASPRCSDQVVSLGCCATYGVPATVCVGIGDLRAPAAAVKRPLRRGQRVKPATSAGSQRGRRRHEPGEHRAPAIVGVAALAPSGPGLDLRPFSWRRPGPTTPPGVDTAAGRRTSIPPSAITTPRQLLQVHPT